MTATRDDVVREARSWIGTRYHHLGMIKVRRAEDGGIIDHGGVDCATLIACVYEAVGLVEPFPIEHYPPDWHLHRDDERYLKIVLERAQEIDPGDAKPGDMLLFRFGRAFAHGAIVVDPGWPAIIHAVMKTGLVHEGHADHGDLRGRPCRAFTLWGDA